MIGVRTFAPAAFCFLALAAGAQEVSQDLKISLDVRRVVLYATVRETRGGGFVGDLKKEDFTVKEDGKVQEVRQFSREDVPIAIGLVIDNSQSMMNKSKEIIAAAKAFVRACNPLDQMFVVHFNDDIQFGLPPGALFTSDHRALDMALDRHTTNGMTALYDGIDTALKHLKKSSLTKKALVVISDGGDNASRRGMNEIVRAAGLSGALFYAIGLYDPLDGDANPGIIRRLARETGGESFFPEQVSEVSALCDSIARDLRNQYMLVYAPQEKPGDAAFHKLEVSVKDPRKRRLVVRTRTGYFGPAAAQGSEGN